MLPAEALAKAGYVSRDEDQIFAAPAADKGEVRPL
jgi:hypothetical protein